MHSPNLFVKLKEMFEDLKDLAAESASQGLSLRDVLRLKEGHLIM